MAALSAGALMGSLLAVGGSAAAQSAPPGGGPQYQVEISYNFHAPNTDPSSGGGIWLWLELDKNGQGIYDGADCAHGIFNPATGQYAYTAVSDQGTLSWKDSNGNVVISGVKLFDIPVPVTITVPATYGRHSGLAINTVITNSPIGPLPPGTTNVQVAP